MDIMLLGPELESAQNAAREELSNEIERRKQEVEKEVVDNLSAVATDGKRVLKSQIKTYEMMLQLDGLVKDNEALFLEVNALCTKTGISLSAIINRMVEKNRQLREDAPAQVEAEAVIIPDLGEDKKKAVSDIGDVASEKVNDNNGLNYTLRPIGDVPLDDGLSLGGAFPWDDDDYNPDEIKYDWQKNTFALSHDSIVQDLPVQSIDEQHFEAPGMDDAAIAASRDKLGFTDIDIPNDGVEESSMTMEDRTKRVIGRRLYSWKNIQDRFNSILKASVCCENLANRSEAYIAINQQIGDLLMSYRSVSPEEDNLALDRLDQMIGDSDTLDTYEKRRLYGKLNRSAQRVERYALAFNGSRK